MLERLNPIDHILILIYIFAGFTPLEQHRHCCARLHIYIPSELTEHEDKNLTDNHSSDLEINDALTRWRRKRKLVPEVEKKLKQDEERNLPATEEEKEEEQSQQPVASENCRRK